MTRKEANVGALETSRRPETDYGAFKPVYGVNPRVYGANPHVKEA